MGVPSRIGQYEIQGRLGAGSAATVHRARHVLLGTEHAVKVLELQDPSIAQRFLREGQLQARLRHPNLVAVTDLIQQDDRVALVMELVGGGTLENRLYFDGPLEPRAAIAILRPLLDALGYAHSQGVFHRDIKPSNVLMDGDKPRLSDFGIAAWSGSGERLTRDGVIMGTPGYMPPELWSNPASTDARTDIFELGAMFYEMLTGRRPFQGASLRETLDRTARGDRPPLEELVPGLPPALVGVVDRALRPKREERFASCAEMSAALDAVVFPAVPLAPVPSVQPASAPPAEEPAPKPTPSLERAPSLVAEATLAEALRPDALAPANDAPAPKKRPWYASFSFGRGAGPADPAGGSHMPVQSLVLVAAAVLVGVVVYDGRPLVGPTGSTATALQDPPPDGVEDTPPADPGVPDPVTRPLPHEPTKVGGSGGSGGSGGTGGDHTTPPAGRACSGWFYAKLPSPPKKGETLPLDVATTVRADYPHDGDTKEARTVCTLPKGSRVRLAKDAVHMVGDHYWVPVKSSMVTLP